MALGGGGGDGLLLELLVELGVVLVLVLAEGRAPGLGILLAAEGLGGLVGRLSAPRTIEASNSSTSPRWPSSLGTLWSSGLGALAGRGRG